MNNNANTLAGILDSPTELWLFRYKLFFALPNRNPLQLLSINNANEARMGREIVRKSVKSNGKRCWMWNIRLNLAFGITRQRFNANQNNS